MEGERYLEHMHEGWKPLLRETLERLNQIANDKHIEDFKIVHIKEKWGMLDIFVNTADRDILDAVAAAEMKSSTICRECGQPGERRTEGWHVTLCDDCNEKRVWMRPR